MERLITKLTFQLEIIIMQRKVKELSYRLAKIKKKKRISEKSEKSDHESITSFKHSFQNHEYRRQLFFFIKMSIIEISIILFMMR
jgi:hypothetical protein